MGEPIQSRFGNIAPFHHTHPDVPKVFVQPDAPTKGMVRGDIWVKLTGVAEPPVEPPVEESTIPEAVMADNPYGYWRLEETSGTVVIDYTGRNHGVLLGTSMVRGDTGAYGYCYRPVSTDGYVTIGEAGTLIDYGQGAFTAECWFKIGAVSDMQQANAMMQLFGTDCWVDAWQTCGWSIYMSARGGTVEGLTLAPGVMVATVAQGTSRGHVVDTARMDDGNWHHVALVFNNEIRLYVDGTVRGTTLPWIGNNPGQKPATIGLNYAFEPNPTSYPAFVFPGNIDEVAFYRTALSTERVLAHYQAR